ncbi:hypothetical protein M153_4440005416, partial [Pseudoloma neurophilia]
MSTSLLLFILWLKSQDDALNSEEFVDLHLSSEVDRENYTELLNQLYNECIGHFDDSLFFDSTELEGSDLHQQMQSSRNSVKELPGKMSKKNSKACNCGGLCLCITMPIDLPGIKPENVESNSERLFGTSLVKNKKTYEKDSLNALDKQQLEDHKSFNPMSFWSKYSDSPLYEKIPVDVINEDKIIVTEPVLEGLHGNDMKTIIKPVELSTSFDRNYQSTSETKDTRKRKHHNQESIDTTKRKCESNLASNKILMKNDLTQAMIQKPDKNITSTVESESFVLFNPQDTKYPPEIVFHLKKHEFYKKPLTLQIFQVKIDFLENTKKKITFQKVPNLLEMPIVKKSEKVLNILTTALGNPREVGMTFTVIVEKFYNNRCQFEYFEPKLSNSFIQKDFSTYFLEIKFPKEINNSKTVYVEIEHTEV